MTDFTKRKKELEDQYSQTSLQINQLNQKVQELTILREQLRGRYQEIEQLEKEKTPILKVKENK